jgi:hypothetical protein
LSQMMKLRRRLHRRGMISLSMTCQHHESPRRDSMSTPVNTSYVDPSYQKMSQAKAMRWIADQATKRIGLCPSYLERKPYMDRVMALSANSCGMRARWQENHLELRAWTIFTCLKRPRMVAETWNVAIPRKNSHLS